MATEATEQVEVRGEPRDDPTRRAAHGRGSIERDTAHGRKDVARWRYNGSTPARPLDGEEWPLMASSLADTPPASERNGAKGA